MKYYDQAVMSEVRSALDDRLLSREGVSTKPMFGCPCYRADGRLFAFLVTGGLVLTQLPQSVRDQLSPSFHTELFEATGRRMKNWLRFPVEAPAALEPLDDLIDVSYSTALLSIDDPQ